MNGGHTFQSTAQPPFIDHVSFIKAVVLKFMRVDVVEHPLIEKPRDGQGAMPFWR